MPFLYISKCFVAPLKKKRNACSSVQVPLEKLHSKTIFLRLKECACFSSMFHLLEKQQQQKKLRYWLQKWNMRRVSLQYNCNCLLGILGCKNSFKIRRYFYIMRYRHIRDFLVHTRLCLKIKFQPVIELIACAFRLHYMA